MLAGRTLIAAALVLQDAPAPRVAATDPDSFHRVAVAAIATTSHTHVCTVGRVAAVRRQADGDVHLRIEDGPAFVVAEVIPQIPIAPPRTGTRVEVCGITRYDKAHRWYELHPVLSLRPEAAR